MKKPPDRDHMSIKAIICISLRWPLFTGLTVYIVTKHCTILFSSTDFHADLLEWGPVYTLWANSEDQLVNALHTMSKTVDTCSEALKDLVSLLL